MITQHLLKSKPLTHSVGFYAFLFLFPLMPMQKLQNRSRSIKKKERKKMYLKKKKEEEQKQDFAL